MKIPTLLLAAAYALSSSVGLRSASEPGSNGHYYSATIAITALWERADPTECGTCSSYQLMDPQLVIPAYFDHLFSGGNAFDETAAIDDLSPFGFDASGTSASGGPSDQIAIPIPGGMIPTLIDSHNSKCAGDGQGCHEAAGDLSCPHYHQYCDTESLNEDEIRASLILASAKNDVELRIFLEQHQTKLVGKMLHVLKCDGSIGASVELNKSLYDTINRIVD